MASLFTRIRRYIRRRREVPRRSVFSRIGRWVHAFLKNRKAARGRNRRRRRLAFTALWLFAVGFVFGGLVYLSHLDALEIKDVTIIGNTVVETADITSVIDETLSGRYGYLFSKRNIVIYPEDEIIAALTAAFPRLVGISLARESLTAIIVSVSERTPVALWCSDVRPQGVTSGREGCYFLDETGYIFAEAPDFTRDVFFTYYGTPATTPAHTSTTTEPLSHRYLPQEQFQELEALLDELAKIVCAPASLDQVNNIDFSLQCTGGSQILFKQNQDYMQVLENAQSVVHSDAFQKERDGRDIARMDLRFGNKIFYSFK